MPQVARCVRALERKAAAWDLDLVITDFEPISCHVGHKLHLPIIAIDNQVRHFRMPGHAIPEFNALTADVAAAGIYSLTDYVEEIVEPLVSTHWVCTADCGLSSTARAARQRTTDFIERTRRIARRL